MRTTTSGMTTSLVRRQLGRRLRALRMAAGKTYVDVHHARVAGRNKLWQIERGRIAVRPGDVMALARLYGVDTATFDELLRLADATAVTNFQEDHDGWAVTEWVGIYSGLEAGARAQRAYNSELIDGLLQTESYARTVIAADRTLTEETIDQRARFRMQRRRRFFERPNPGRLQVVMSAGALNLVVGSSATMEEQIAHLRTVDEGDEVSVRVLSATDGVHTAMNGAFRIMDFDDPDDPPLVYLESLSGSRYVEREQQVSVYREAFERLWAQASPLREHLE